MTRPQPDTRSAYARVALLTARWMDSDVSEWITTAAGPGRCCHPPTSQP